jgi:hypothetical protein
VENESSTSGERAIENDFYRVEMDENGAVVSLIDKDLARELVRPGPWRLNQLVYETITSPGGRADVLAPKYPPFDFMPGRAEVSLASPAAATIRVRRDRFGISLISTACMEHFSSVEQEVRLPHDRKQVDFATRAVKEAVDSTEAAYVAFPFALTPDHVRCDIPGGSFTPGSEQIRGTATDWYNIWHGVQLADDEIALTWLCGEAPLVEFGEMKTGKTPSQPITENGLLFSYVLNNHWMTNFFARQSGEIVARFRLFSDRKASPAALGQKGRELLEPLVVARLGARSARDAGLEIAASSLGAGEGSFAELLEGTAALDAVKAACDGDGWIVRLHETGGNRGVARFRLRWPLRAQATPCNLIERPLPGVPSISLAGEGILEATLAPFGTASWRVCPVT